MLADVRAESTCRSKGMCAKLNAHLDAVKAGFSIDFKQVVKDLTRGSVRSVTREGAEDGGGRGCRKRRGQASPL